jgi:hypothetical protein
LLVCEERVDYLRGAVLIYPGAVRTFRASVALGNSAATLRLEN